MTGLPGREKVWRSVSIRTDRWRDRHRSTTCTALTHSVAR